MQTRYYTEDEFYTQHHRQQVRLLHNMEEPGCTIPQTSWLLHQFYATDEFDMVEGRATLLIQILGTLEHIHAVWETQKGKVEVDPAIADTFNNCLPRLANYVAQRLYFISKELPQTSGATGMKALDEITPVEFQFYAMSRLRRKKDALKALKALKGNEMIRVKNFCEQLKAQGVSETDMQLLVSHFDSEGDGKVDMVRVREECAKTLKIRHSEKGEVLTSKLIKTGKHLFHTFYNEEIKTVE